MKLGANAAEKYRTSLELKKSSVMWANNDTWPASVKVAGATVS